MKITKVELQKKDKTRFSLFSGEEYIASASYENLLPYGFSEFEISEEDLKELIKKDEVEKAFKGTIKYVSKSLKSTKEVRDYLYKKNLKSEFHDEIIFKLEDLGLLDDKKYLEIFLEEKFNYSTDGSIKIKNKLYLKGFDKSEVDPYLPKYYDLELKNLKDLINSRIKARKNEDKNKLIRYLLSKGYEYSMINEVIGEYFDDSY